MNFWKVIGGFVVVVVVIGAIQGSLGGGESRSTGSTTVPAGSAATAQAASARTPASMFGTKYSVTVQERIDTMADHRDCAGLQDEFDTADANNAATRNRTGSGTVDLMGYIDDAMRRVGCYG